MLDSLSSGIIGMENMVIRAGHSVQFECCDHQDLDIKLLTVIMK